VTRKGRIGLPQLPRALAAVPGIRRTPSYRELYHAVINGDIPGNYEGGRWYIEEADIPAIALQLGLMPQPKSRPASKGLKQ